MTMAMGLDAAVASLARALARLHEAVADLHLTVTEDWPTAHATKPVGDLDTLLTDLTSTVEQARAGAARALTDLQTTGGVDGTRSALQNVNALMHDFTAGYIGTLAHHDHVARLLEMGRERGHGWREWCQVVKAAIEKCAAPRQEVDIATASCWLELADRLARHAGPVPAGLNDERQKELHQGR